MNMIENDMNDTFRTKDLAEAAFLYASSKKLISLDEDKDRYWFVFQGRSSCEALAVSFWQKEALVNAKEYADAFRTLKDIVFNKERR